MTFQRLRARVCIGMPVFNGQRHIAEAIDSIISQTFADLELIICDDASTDATEAICRSLTKRDPRITYIRNPHPIGEVRNYERAYQFCGGQYFKWATNEDVLEPTLIEKCVLALDADSSAVLAYPRSLLIDEHGHAIKLAPPRLATDSTLPQKRFAAVALANHRQPDCHEIFGLIRRSTVDRIPQQGAFTASDRVFLARLALYGRFLEIPDLLFLSRDQSTRPGFGARDDSKQIAFPEWRLAWEYLQSIRYGWLNTPTQLACIGSILLRQAFDGNWARMVRDIAEAGEELASRYLTSGADQVEPHIPPTIPHPARSTPTKAAA